jgi:hypothetical protein
MAIEHKFPKAPPDIIYATLSFLQKWSLIASRGGRSPTISACEGRNPALDEKFQA